MSTVADLPRSAQIISRPTLWNWLFPKPTIDPERVAWAVPDADVKEFLATVTGNSWSGEPLKHPEVIGAVAVELSAKALGSPVGDKWWSHWEVEVVFKRPA